MSLRGRLLLAVGAVALVALVVADIATYSALRSFLYQRVDSSLDTAHFALERALSPHGPPGETTVAAFAPGTFVEVRDADGTILGMQGGHRPGGEQLIPQLPDRIEGLDASTADAGPGEPRRYLTV